MPDTTFVDLSTTVMADWLNDVNRFVYDAQTPSSTLGASLLGYQSSDTGAVARTVQGKLEELPSRADFGTNTEFANTVGGGVGIVPSGSYSLNTFSVAQPGTYLNGSDSRFSTDLMNVGETVGVTTTRNIEIDSVTGLNNGKRRFSNFVRSAMEGAGSTIAINGTGDYSRGTFAYKVGYNLTPVAGEIGGNYTVVRQGGASGTLNDCSAELYDVSTFSNSFACLTEGVTTKISGGSVTDAVRVQTGFLNKGTGDMGGTAVSIDTGVASNIDYREVQTGASATNLFKYVNHNAAVGRKDLFNITGNGNITAVMRDNLGAVLGNNVIPLSWSVYNNNKDSMVAQLIRTAAGSDFTTSEWRLQRTIDATTGGGLILGYHATRGYTASLSSNGTALLTQTSNLYVGFNGATPIQKPVLNAAATDLATVIALTNQIRAALINYGLAT